MLSRFRRQTCVLARFNLALFALVWLSAVAAPCAMAMHAEPAGTAAHDCPHCAPRPCHEVEPVACELPDFDLLLSVDKTLSIALAAPTAYPLQWIADDTATEPLSIPRIPARAGPRSHLVHQQFNE